MYKVPFLILLPSHFQSLTLKNVTSVKFISLHHRRAMLVVAKRVTWTLHPNRPRKTGSRYNDILSCVGKPKGSVTMSQKGCLTPLLTMRCSTKTALGGHFTPPPLIAGIRVKNLEGKIMGLHIKIIKGESSLNMKVHCILSFNTLWQPNQIFTETVPRPLP